MLKIETETVAVLSIEDRMIEKFLTVDKARKLITVAREAVRGEMESNHDNEKDWFAQSYHHYQEVFRYTTLDADLDLDNQINTEISDEDAVRFIKILLFNNSSDCF